MKPAIADEALAVVKLYAEGKTHKEIAEARKCSLANVSYHLLQARRKLGFPSGPRLIHWAIATGLTPLIR